MIWWLWFMIVNLWFWESDYGLWTYDDEGCYIYLYIYTTIHPLRLTWNLRIHPWKRKIFFQTHHFQVNLCFTWTSHFSATGQLVATSDHLINDNDQYQFHHHHDLPWKILGGPMKKVPKTLELGVVLLMFSCNPRKRSEQKKCWYHHVDKFHCFL